MGNYYNDLTVLAHYSDMAKEMVVSDKKVCISEIDSISNTGFHPNGKCGCINLNDDYLFGIRCDHFMWTEFWTEDDFAVIIIYGNHKGSLISKCIMMYEGEDDKDVEYNDVEYIVKK